MQNLDLSPDRHIKGYRVMFVDGFETNIHHALNSEVFHAKFDLTTQEIRNRFFSILENEILFGADWSPLNDKGRVRWLFPRFSVSCESIDDFIGERVIRISSLCENPESLEYGELVNPIPF